MTHQESDKLGLTLSHSKQTESDDKGEVTATYAAYINDIALDQFFRHRMTVGVVQHIPGFYSAQIGADVLLNGLYRDVEFSLADDEIKVFIPYRCEDSFLAYWDDKASSVPLVVICRRRIRGR